MISWPCAARSPAMQAANAPTPGTTQAVGLERRGAVSGQRDVGAGALERAHRRADVARAVVEDDNRGIAVTERALGRRHAGLPRVERDRVAQRPGERLELRLDDVVRVAAGQHPHVQASWAWKASVSKHVPGQRPEVGRCRRWSTYSWPVGLAGVHAVGTAGHVDDAPAPAPRRAAPWRRRSGGCRLVAERLAQRLAEHDRGVLDGVVRVDVQVAARPARSGRSASAGRAR